MTTTPTLKILEEHTFIFCFILCEKRQPLFFLVLENQCFTGFVKWIYARMSEIKTNVIWIIFCARLGTLWSCVVLLQNSKLPENCFPHSIFPLSYFN